MNKFLGIAVLCLLLSGCATTSPDVTQNKIRIGMSKSDFCYEAGSMSAKKDPCRLTYTEMLNNKPRGPYYPDTKMEIMYNLTSETYYVFENVTIQHDWYKPFKGVLSIETKGNGTLAKIFNNYDEAKKFASGLNFSIKTDKISQAKQDCKDEGLTEGTESFAECTLKKLKE
jgi:hypothetical protein